MPLQVYFSSCGSIDLYLYRNNVNLDLYLQDQCMAIVEKKLMFIVCSYYTDGYERSFMDDIN